MNILFSRTLCTLMAILIGIQPAILSAHDFGGTSVPGSAPADQMDRDRQKNQTAGGKVSLFDGSESFDTTDLTVNGIYPIAITRRYDSHSTYDSPLGYGWDHPYNIRLFTYADGSVVIRWNTGLKNRFVSAGSGFVDESGASGQLLENIDGTFTFFTPGGIRYEFNLNGNISRLQDTNGNYLSFSYSASKMPLTGISPFSTNPGSPRIISYSYQLLKISEGTIDGLTGRFVNFTYDSGNGRLNTVTDFSGRTVSYVHDSNGNLIRVNYPENLFHAFSYTDSNDPHNITQFIRGYTEGINDYSSVLYENTYDDQDRVIRQNRAGGTLQFDYTIPLAKTTVTRTVVDDKQSVLHTFVTVYEYNSNGFLTRFTDEIGNRNDLIRDSQNNIIRRVNWENTGSPSSPNLHEYTTTNYSYDADSNLISSRMTLDDGEILSWTYTYDHGWLQSAIFSSSRFPARDRTELHEFAYNAEGYPKYVTAKKILTVAGSTPEYLTTTSSHNAYGQLTEITATNGETDTLTYTDGFLTGQNGFSLTRSSDGRGNIVQITDSAGNYTTFTYDSFDRLLQQTNTLGESSIITWQGWNAVGFEAGKTTSLQGVKMQVAYDSYDRIVSRSIQQGAGAVSLTSYAYDSSNNLLQISNPSGQNISYEYDGKDRMISQTHQNGAVTRYSFDAAGNLTTVTDAQNSITSYAYDDYNRLITVVSAKGDTTRYTYEFDVVDKITDGSGNELQFSYDLADRLIYATSMSGNSEQYVYDSKGRITGHTDANGLQTSYTYNDNDYVTSLLIHSSPQRQLDFTYDAGGNMLTYRDSEIAATPAFSYTYDSQNRLATETNHLINKTIDYTYTALGQLKQLRLQETGGADLFSYTYTYDDAGLLTVIEESPSLQTQLAHDEFGRLSSISYFNGITADISYNSDGHMQTLAYRKSDSTPIESYQYQYDTLGRLVQVDDSHGTTAYTYDPNGQLTGAAYPVGSGMADDTFSYDSSGNRSSSTVFSDWTYDGNNSLTHFGSTAFSYDNNGNMISRNVSDQATQYTYDELNRLTGIHSASGNSTYIYDSANRRIKKEVNGTGSWFMYNGYRPIAEFDNDGNLLRHYGFFPESHALVSITDNNGAHAVLNDKLAVPRIITDPAETTLWNGSYKVFGEMAANEDVDGDGTSFHCNLRFPGQYFDAESNLHYNSYRFYDPAIGRYTSVDPLAVNIYSPEDLNSYTYAHSDPVGFIDPDGRASVFQNFWTNYKAGMAGKLGGWRQAGLIVSSIGLLAGTMMVFVGSGAALAVVRGGTIVARAAGSGLSAAGRGIAWTGRTAVSSGKVVFEAGKQGYAALGRWVISKTASGSTLYLVEETNAFAEFLVGTSGTVLPSASSWGSTVFGTYELNKAIYDASSQYTRAYLNDRLERWRRTQRPVRMVSKEALEKLDKKLRKKRKEQACIDAGWCWP